MTGFFTGQRLPPNGSEGDGANDAGPREKRHEFAQPNRARGSVPKRPKSRGAELTRDCRREDTRERGILCPAPAAVFCTLQP